METVGAILGLAVIVGIVILINKAKDAASKALTQKVIYRKKFEKGKHILSGFTFETTASLSAVMRQLDMRVVVAEVPSGLNARLYVAVRRPERIEYVYGNKFSDSFRVAVVLESRETGTLGVLKPIQWHEQEGIIVAQERLAEMLDQVRAAVREVDPSAAFVEGIHDSIELTAPAGEPAPASDAWPALEPEQDVPAPIVAPEAVADAAPAADLVPYAEPVTPIVPPTTANSTLQWIGIALVAGAMLWIGVGVRVSLLPVWFAILAAGGSIIYLVDRAARARRTSPGASEGAGTPTEVPPAATPEVQPTLIERLNTDESEPDPYAWTEPKTEAPGSLPVTLNGLLGGLWNVVIGVAGLAVGGWSLLTGELGVFPSLLMIAGGVYFLASRSFEGRVAVFVNRIADAVACRLLAAATTGSGRLDAAGKSVKPVVLGRCVLAAVAIVGLGYGIKGLSGVGDVTMTFTGDGSISTSTTSGSPLAWIAFLVGITPLWVWPAMEKRAALGAPSAPATPGRQAEPVEANSAKRGGVTSATEEFGVFSDADSGAGLPESVQEPSAEEFALAAEELSVATAPTQATATAPSKLVPYVVAGVAAVVIVGIVGYGFISQARRPESALSTPSASASSVAVDSAGDAETATPSESEDDDYVMMADRGPDDVDPFTLSPDIHQRYIEDLFPSAPADGSVELLDVVYLGSDTDDFSINSSLTIVGRTPAEWYALEIPLDLGYYIDGSHVTVSEFLKAANAEEHVKGMIVFDQEMVYELHVFTRGQSAADDARLAGGRVSVPDYATFDITAEEWETLDWADAMTAYIGAVEEGFAHAGLVGNVELVYYTGTEQPAQDPPAGSSVPAGTIVRITIPSSS